MKQYTIHEVFTPTSPARVTFIERDNINDKLVSALRTPGKQIVVYGNSGSGKTTLLLNKLHQLYERHIISRCMKGMSFEQLILDAFDQLSPFYLAEQSNSTTKEVGAKLSADYLGIKQQLALNIQSQSTGKQQRVLPPQLTAQALGRFLGESGCCWVLEDFHKVEESEKVKLSQLMKIFMDLADEYKPLKIIAIGAVDTARQVVQYDDELRNRVAEIHVPLMSPIEIQAIIKKGEIALNIRIDDNTQRAVARYSSGMASVCHHVLPQSEMDCAAV